LAPIGCEDLFQSSILGSRYNFINRQFPLRNLDSPLGQQLNHRIAGNTGKNRSAVQRCSDNLITDYKKALDVEELPEEYREVRLKLRGKGIPVNIANSRFYLSPIVGKMFRQSSEKCCKTQRLGV